MYSSVTDVRNALSPGGSTSDPGTPASLEESDILDVIAEADGIIDGYISSRYTVPEDVSVGGVAVSPIRWWSRTIAAWLVTLTYRNQQDVPADEPIRLRYEQVISFLVQVRDGAMDLGALSENTSESGDQVFVENLYETKLFPSPDYPGSKGSWQPVTWVRL